MNTKTQVNLLAAAVGCSLALPGVSQESNVGKLEEILVTADKLNARSALDTPLAVSVIGGNEIEERGFSRASDLLRDMPGVSATNLGLGTQNINIRGVGTDAVGDPAVGYYLDEVPFVIPQLDTVPDTNPYDLDRVEVLRGPQGTLYGANSLAGTVKVITRQPDHDGFYAKVTAGYSTIDDGGSGYKVQGAVNIPLIDDTLSARLVGSYIDQEGYIDMPLTGEKDFNDYEEENYRAKLRYTATDSLEFTASYWSYEVSQFPNLSNEDYEFSPVNFLLDPITGAPTGNVRAVSADDTAFSNSYDIYNMTMSMDFGDNYNLFGTLSRIDIERDLNGSYAFFPNRFKADTTADNLEIRLSYRGEGSWSWLLGAFALDNDGAAPTTSTIYFDTDPVFSVETVLTDQERSSEQWAVFGELSYEFSPEWAMTLGARYFEDKRTETETDPTSLAGITATVLGVPLSRSETFDKPTGRVNLAYTPTEDSLYYVNIASGFRSGNVQCTLCLSSPTVPRITEPEDMISYEMGAKLQFPDTGFIVDAAIYYWDWDEIQVFLQDFSNPLVPLAFVDNVGSADAAGVDIGITYNGVPGLDLFFGGNWNNAEYGESLPGAGIEKGDSVANSPEYTVTASASYIWPLTSGLEGSVYAAWYAIGDRSNYSVGVPPTEIDGYDEVTLRAGLLDTDGKWNVYLSATNLLNSNEVVAASGAFIAVGSSPVYQIPRTIGLEATFNF